MKKKSLSQFEYTQAERFGAKGKSKQRNKFLYVDFDSIVYNGPKERTIVLGDLFRRGYGKAQGR